MASDSAAVRVLVVSDYQCDSCRTWFEQYLPQLRAEYIETGKARLTWVHYPLRGIRQPCARPVRRSAPVCRESSGTRVRDCSTRRPRGAPHPVRTRSSTRWQSSLASRTSRLKNCIDSDRMLRQIRRDIDWTDTAKAGAPLTHRHRQTPESAGSASIRNPSRRTRLGGRARSDAPRAPLLVARHAILTTAKGQHRYPALALDFCDSRPPLRLRGSRVQQPAWPVPEPPAPH